MRQRRKRYRYRSNASTSKPTLKQRLVACEDSLCDTKKFKSELLARLDVASSELARIDLEELTFNAEHARKIAKLDKLQSIRKELEACEKQIRELSAVLSSAIEKLSSVPIEVLANLLFSRRRAQAEEVKRKTESELAVASENRDALKKQFDALLSGETREIDPAARRFRVMTSTVDFSATYKEPIDMNKVLQLMQQTEELWLKEITFHKSYVYMISESPNSMLLKCKGIKWLRASEFASPRSPLGYYPFSDSISEWLRDVQAEAKERLRNLSVEREKFTNLPDKLLEIDQVICRLSEEAADLRRKVEKHLIRDAKAASYDGKIRNTAAEVRKILHRMDSCPYCCMKIVGEPHADHIVPVDLGGLSVASNMVLVCSNCNLSKSSLTLRQFCIKSGFDRNEVESRLIALGKIV